MTCLDRFKIEHAVRSFEKTINRHIPPTLKTAQMTYPGYRQSGRLTAAKSMLAAGSLYLYSLQPHRYRSYVDDSSSPTDIQQLLSHRRLQPR